MANRRLPDSTGFNCRERYRFVSNTPIRIRRGRAAQRQRCGSRLDVVSVSLTTPRTSTCSSAPSATARCARLSNRGRPLSAALVPPGCSGRAGRCRRGRWPPVFGTRSNAFPASSVAGVANKTARLDLRNYSAVRADEKNPAQEPLSLPRGRVEITTCCRSDPSRAPMSCTCSTLIFCIHARRPLALPSLKTT